MGMYFFFRIGYDTYKAHDGMKRKKRKVFGFGHRNIVLLVIFFLVIVFVRPQYPINKSTDVFTPVLYVVDGDTISVSINGQDKRVRLIGINAPEEYPKEKKQCYADEAKAKMVEFVDKKKVSLTSDPTQDDTDVYGRLLRYVTLPDGTNVNQEMIRGGFAKEYTFRNPYEERNEFIGAELDAKEKRIGVVGSV